MCTASLLASIAPCLPSYLTFFGHVRQIGISWLSREIINPSLSSLSYTTTTTLSAPLKHVFHKHPVQNNRLIADIYAHYCERAFFILLRTTFPRWESLISWQYGPVLMQPERFTWRNTDNECESAVQYESNAMAFPVCSPLRSDSRWNTWSWNGKVSFLGSWHRQHSYSFNCLQWGILISLWYDFLFKTSVEDLMKTGWIMEPGGG